jgi:hypothetical protein
MKFEIKHRFSGAIIFTLECGSLKLCVEAAVKAKTDLGGADLGGAYLRGADLRGAYLRGADLRGAYLRGAARRGAYRRGADLRGAYLRGADLGGADLRGADLGGADLGGQKVSGDIGIITAGDPNSYTAVGFVEEETGALRVIVGCRSKSITEGRAYWSSEAHPNRDARREVLAALDYIEAVARLRGWEPQ